jgi:hypothetical protein
MELTTEYLAIFQTRTDPLCDSADSFIQILQVKGEIRVHKRYIVLDEERICGFLPSDGRVPDKDQCYVRLRFTWDGDPDADTESLKRFQSLLKKVRTMLDKAGAETATLWDDLSSHYAKKAYPLIHEIENLMRRLIANFMLVRVGLEWEKEALPKALKDAVAKSKRQGSPNVLHAMDFIHLGEFLFKPYPKGTDQELYAKIRAVKTAEDATALQEYIPASNWKRYFSELVDCEDGYLKSRWERLYDLRCKVAHNAPMSDQELEAVRNLVGEVRPRLQEAIDKLSNVTVPPEEAELVAETAARTVSTTIVGEFITCWQALEAEIDSHMKACGETRRRIYQADELTNQGVLPSAWKERYDAMRQIRNNMVHGPATSFPEQQIQYHLSAMRDLLACVKAGSYVEWLKGLSEDELQCEIGSRVEDTIHMILESDEFIGIMSATNATGFDIDACYVKDIDLDQDGCVAKVAFYSTGEQLEDRPYCGDQISGEVDAVFDAEGNLEYRNLIVGVARDDDADLPPSDCW